MTNVDFVNALNINDRRKKGNDIAYFTTHPSL